MDLSNRKKLIIIIVLVVVIIGIIFLGNRNNGSKTNDITSGQGQYYDSNSGETVSNPSGKTADNYGAVADAPIFLGDGKILDYGITLDEVKDMQYSVYQYFKSKGQKVSEVSVVAKSISAVPHDPNSANTYDTINFDIVVDRKTKYKVKMNYFDLVSIQLFIYDEKGGTQLYDSGTVTSQHL